MARRHGVVLAGGILAILTLTCATASQARASDRSDLVTILKDESSPGRTTRHHATQASTTTSIIFGDGRSSPDQIINNIFYDVGSGNDSYACGNPTIASNDFFLPGVATPVGNYCSNAPSVSVDPLFMNYGDSTRAGADYRLQRGSPINDTGTTLSEVPKDYDRYGAADRPGLINRGVREMNDRFARPDKIAAGFGALELSARLYRALLGWNVVLIV